MGIWQCHFRLENFQWPHFLGIKSPLGLLLPPFHPLPSFLQSSMCTHVYTHTHPFPGAGAVSKLPLSSVLQQQYFWHWLVLIYLCIPLSTELFSLHGPGPLETSQNEILSFTDCTMGIPDGALLLGVICMGGGWGEAIQSYKECSATHSGVTLESSLPSGASLGSSRFNGGNDSSTCLPGWWWRLGELVPHRSGCSQA